MMHAGWQKDHGRLCCSGTEYGYHEPGEREMAKADTVKDQTSTPASPTSPTSRDLLRAGPEGVWLAKGAKTAKVF
jgi:hypothetical protein